MRNRLLNFIPTKLSTLKIVDELPSEVYSRLVLDENKMGFRASQPRDFEVAKEEDLVWNFDLCGVQDRHTDRYLQTDVSDADLMRI